MVVLKYCHAQTTNMRQLTLVVQGKRQHNMWIAHDPCTFILAARLSHSYKIQKFRYRKKHQKCNKVTSGEWLNQRFFLSNQTIQSTQTIWEAIELGIEDSEKQNRNIQPAGTSCVRWLVGILQVQRISRMVARVKLLELLVALLWIRLQRAL